MDQLLLAFQIFSSAVLLVAATGKVIRSDDFAAALRLSRLPAAGFLLVAIPAIEFALALALVIATPASLTVSLALTTGLFGSFIIWAASVLVRGIRLKCGCFGGSSREVSMRTVVRNMALLAAAGAGTILSLVAESPLTTPTLWSAVTATSIATMVSVSVAVRFGFGGLVLRLDQMNPIQPLLQIDPKG
ncbi:MAG: MauE/DoxX family redox-associated membrane protein [Actinomycetota bacterium]